MSQRSAKNPSHRVVFIGDTAVGKTSIINQYVYNTSSADHQPTVGIDFFCQAVRDGDRTIRMQIWDTAGQEKFHALIPSYIRNSTVAVLVFDITSQQSFEDLKKWHKTVSDIADPSLVVVGNKVDLESSRAVTDEQARQYADSIKAPYMETSARTPINIPELFTMIAKLPIPSETGATPADHAEPEVEKVDIKAIQATQRGGCSC